MQSLESILPSPSWTYAGVTRYQTAQSTHVYHRYPARFIPQLARRLIRTYSQPGDLVVDPFAGCGTTLLEGMLLGRQALGIDINPLADIICKAKTTAIEPNLLKTRIESLQQRITSKVADKGRLTGVTKQILESRDEERISYWFPRRNIEELSALLYSIYEERNIEVRRLFKVAFSHILKSASLWSSQSVKAFRILSKKPRPATALFQEHFETIFRRNSGLWRRTQRLRIPPSERARFVLGDYSVLDEYCSDASLILTSPPYNFAYDYVELHELSLFWLFQNLDFTSLRKKLVGRKINPRTGTLNSPLGQSIVDQLPDTPSARTMSYFLDLQNLVDKCYTATKRKGYLCFVIGNSRSSGLEVNNAGVLVELLKTTGAHLRVIKRAIPTAGKSLPTLRDHVTGSFVKKNGTPSFPSEYIVIARKT